MARKRKNETREPSTGASAYRHIHARIEGVRRWRRDRSTFNNEHDWQRALRFVKNQHWQDVGTTDPSSESPRDRITVNRIGSMVQDFLAFLFNHDPVWRGKARNDNGIAAARVGPALLNYFWQRQRMTPQARKAVFDGITIGHGVIKTGYTYEVDAPEVNEDGRVENSQYIRRDHPYIRRVSPLLFYFDPGARDRDLHTARWVAEFFFVPKNELLANARYSESVRSQLKQDGAKLKTVRDFLTEHDFAKGNDSLEAWLREIEFESADELVVCFEYWDRRFDKFYVFAEGVEEPLLEEAWPYDYLDGFPYVMFNFIDVPDEPYGLGLPRILEDQQIELNRIRTAQFVHRRRTAARKYQAVEGQIEEAELDKLVNGPDGSIVKVSVPNAVTPIETAPFTQDQYAAENTIREDLRELSGSDQLMSGGNLPSRTTAAEVRARSGLIGVKLDARVAVVDSFIDEIGNQVYRHLRANLSTQQVLRLQGPAGEQAWVPVSRADLEHEIDLELRSTTKEKTDPQMDRQQALQVMSTVFSALPMLQQMQAPIDVVGVFRWAMSKFEDKELEQFIGAPLPLPPVPPSGGAAGGASVPAAGNMPDPTMVAGPESTALAGGLGGMSLGAGV